MQTYVEFVVRGLVENPETVEVQTEEREGLTVYRVILDSDDMGKVIGKQGNTVNAVRGLLQAGSAKKGIRTALEVVERQV